MKKNIIIYTIFLSCSYLALTSCTHDEEMQTKKRSPLVQRNILPAGRHIENFTLFDQQDQAHELYRYRDQKVIVLISHGVGCPIGRLANSAIHEMKKEYEPQGVTFLMINANLQDDPSDIVQEAEEYNITIPILKDSTQVVTKSLNIRRTVEAVVIDPRDWKIVYQGAIDDKYGYETQKIEAKNHYLRNALDAVLTGKEVKVPYVMVKGCLINLDYY